MSRYDIKVVQNDYKVFHLVWKDKNGPIDLSGYTGRLQIRSSPDSKLLSEHTAIIQETILQTGQANAVNSDIITISGGDWSQFTIGNFVSFGSISSIFEIKEIISSTQAKIDSQITLTNDTFSLAKKGEIKVQLDNNKVPGCHAYGLEVVSGGLTQTILRGQYIIEPEIVQ